MGKDRDRGKGSAVGIGKWVRMVTEGKDRDRNLGRERDRDMGNDTDNGKDRDMGKALWG